MREPPEAVRSSSPECRRRWSLRRNALNVEVGDGGVELAVNLESREYVRNEVGLVQIGIGVEEAVEIGDESLARELGDGEAAEVENVRHVAGHDLGGELGETGGVIIVGVVLGVVVDLNTVLVAIAVELDYELLRVPVESLSTERDVGLLRQAAGGDFADGDKLAGAVFVFAVHSL